MIIRQIFYFLSTRATSKAANKLNESILAHNNLSERISFWRLYIRDSAADYDSYRLWLLDLATLWRITDSRSTQWEAICVKDKFDRSQGFYENIKCRYFLEETRRMDWTNPIFSVERFWPRYRRLQSVIGCWIPADE